MIPKDTIDKIIDAKNSKIKTLQQEKESWQKEKEEWKKEKEKLYEQVSTLLDKVGDTNIQQNNIILNSYGNEDLSHITTTVWSVDNNPCESQQWVEAVDELDKKGFLLGQNEQVRGNHIHITQHWVNDLYATPMVGVKNFMDPIERVYGELNNPIHVL